MLHKLRATYIDGHNQWSLICIVLNRVHGKDQTGSDRI